jgi:signal transduction histidine kinase
MRPGLHLLKICAIMYLLGTSTYGYAQTRRIDSLKKLITHATNVADRSALLLGLCEESGSMNADSLFVYASEAKRLNPVPPQKALYLPEYYIARSLVKRGLLDSAYMVAVNYVTQLEEKKLVDIPAYRMFLASKGNMLIRKSEFKEGIEQYYTLLRNAEMNNDTAFREISENGIGWAYMEMNRYPEALAHFHAALKMDEDGKHERYTIYTLSNIAAVQNSIGNNDSAALYIDRAIKAAIRYEDLTTLANALNIKASLFIDDNRPELAEEPLRKALELRKQIGDPFYIVSDMSQLASYYAHNGKPKEGIALCLQAVEMANRYKLTAKLRLVYRALAENYKAAGDMAGYGRTLEDLLALNDSLYTKNAVVDLASIQARYQLQTKENIIIRQKLAIVQKSYLFYSALGLLLITGLFSIIIFRNYRKKQKLKIRLMQQQEAMMMNEAIKDAEEKERKRIAADLHDNLGVYAAAIASNVDNAIRRDGAEEKAMNELKANSHALVAQLSDTIWALKKDTLTLTAISDRIKVFLQRIHASYPNISMEVNEHIDNDVTLSPSQAYHLFCIVQEGVNNAVKHSNGSEIIVLIISRNAWKISIKDNGIGMKHGEEGGSNGLYNMNTRAAANKWQITWGDNNGKGTIIDIYPKET